MTWKLKRTKTCCSFRLEFLWMRPVVLCQVSPSRIKVCRPTMLKNSSATYHSQVNSNKRLAAPHDAFCPRVRAFPLFFVSVGDHLHSVIFSVYYHSLSPPRRKPLIRNHFEPIQTNPSYFEAIFLPE